MRGETSCIAETYQNTYVKHNSFHEGSDGVSYHPEAGHKLFMLRFHDWQIKPFTTREDVLIGEQIDIRGVLPFHGKQRFSNLRTIGQHNGTMTQKTKATHHI